MTKSYADKTSADDKSIGFDYQYYFFLWKLLELSNTGQTVGLEVYDDVHTQIQDGEQTLYQLKHTTLTKADGSPNNLTRADTDLWKTLYTWVLMITDESLGRKEPSSQIEFVSNTNFVLASNKSGENNDVLGFIKDFQENRDVDILIKNITDFKTNDKKLQLYIKKILSLDTEVLNLFFTRINFKLNTDNLIENCKQAIRAKMIPEKEINRVFGEVDSKVRQENYKKIKNKEKIVISFETFHKQYQRYFNLSRDNSLQFTDDKFELPKSLNSQEFIKRLIEIKEITEDDFEDILEFTTFKMRIESQILFWESEGYIVQKEIDEFKNNAIALWKNKFKKLFRIMKSNPNANDDFLISQSLLDELREVELNISHQAIGLERSNGQYYSFLDHKQIHLVSN